MQQGCNTSLINIARWTRTIHHHIHHQSTTTTTNPRPHLHVSVGQVWHRSYGRSNGRWRPPKMEEPTTIHPVHERHSKHTGRIVRHLEEQWFVGRHDRRLHVSCTSCSSCSPCFSMFLHVSTRFYMFHRPCCGLLFQMETD